MNASSFIVPVYINEKIVLDMLAILEDGFSMVSQVNYVEENENSTSKKIEANVSTSATLLSKLLKINISGDLNSLGKNESKQDITREKVHTNVSLLYKFREYLKENHILKTEQDISSLEIGDIVEVEGELEKNPLIQYLEILQEALDISILFTETPPVGERTKGREQNHKNIGITKQLNAFTEKLKHSGTIDFILSDKNGTVVLSAQEQYLANDNISEIIGGRFRVLGKVISIAEGEKDSIDLLRKTFFSYVSDEILQDFFSGLQNKEESQELSLPELKTKISGPAIIVIPIAIYA